MSVLQPKQFVEGHSPAELVDRVAKLKRRSQVRAQPRPGNVQPYLPFPDHEA